MYIYSKSVMFLMCLSLIKEQFPCSINCRCSALCGMSCIDKEAGVTTDSVGVRRQQARNIPRRDCEEKDG